MDRDLDAELGAHIEHQADAYERAGVPRAEALRRARIDVGGVEPIKEATRDARGTGLVDSLLQDARYAVRTLRKEPSFTVTMVLILAIGIGANTATFTLVRGLLLRPLPVPHPDGLVTIGDPTAVTSDWHGSPETDYVSFPLYRDVRDRNTTLSGLYATGAANPLDIVVRGAYGTHAGGTIEHPDARLVSGNYFSVLEVPAAVGRTFAAAEDTAPRSDPVVVISDGYWRRRFGGDPSAVGSTIAINTVPFSIVGVTARGFDGDIVGHATDLWIPLTMEPAIRTPESWLENREWSWLVMMGRLRPGVTVAQARAEMAVIEPASVRAHLGARLLAEFEQDLKDHPIQVASGSRGFSSDREEYRASLLLLMAAVGLVVLIVCANAANLMLVRAVTRGREMTVRMTLGAGRGRLIRQLLTESALLGAAGGLLGLFAAVQGSHALLVAASPESRTIALDVWPDAAVLGFTAALTLAAVVLFGLVPAFHATRLDLATSLRAQGRNLIGARARVGRFGAGKALVVAQISLSAVLLVGAGLLARSVQRILSADLGSDRNHLVLAHISAGRAGYESARMPLLLEELHDRIQRVPGVAAVSSTMHGIFSGGYGTMRVIVTGYSAAIDANREVRYDPVGPGYFHAIGARILRGRDIEARDTATSMRVAVVNETLARAYFGAADPIGRALADEDEPTEAYTIVGVVRDVQDRGVRSKPMRTLYLASNQLKKAPTSIWIAARAGGDPTSVVAPIRRAIADVDPAVGSGVFPLNQLVRRTIADDLLVMRATALFGIVALALAALGLYGLTAYATSQRVGEFGLRVALGAAPGSVSRMVLRESLVLAGAGLAVGLPAAVAATRLIRGRIFGVGPLDPPSWLLVVALLAATALFAGYVPARRAARIAPVEALRAE